MKYDSRNIEDAITKAEKQKHEEALRDTYERRADRYGLTIEQAKSDRAGTALGRAFLKGKITNKQYIAGDRFRQLVDYEKQLMGLPRELRSPGYGDMVDTSWRSSKHDVDEDRSEEIAEVRRELGKMGEAVAVGGHESIMAVRTVLFGDQDYETMYPALKVALERLRRVSK